VAPSTAKGGPQDNIPVFPRRPPTAILLAPKEKNIHNPSSGG